MRFRPAGPMKMKTPSFDDCLCDYARNLATRDSSMTKREGSGYIYELKLNGFQLQPRLVPREWLHLI